MSRAVADLNDGMEEIEVDISPDISQKLLEVIWDDDKIHKVGRFPSHAISQ